MFSFTNTKTIGGLMATALVAMLFAWIPDQGPSDPASPDSTLRQLYADEAFLLAQNAENKIGRPSLSLDLQDSTATLWIRGIAVHTAPILAFEKSALWNLRSDGGLMDDLRIPFTLVSSEASIPHAPIREIQAPSDTAEARLRPPESFVVDTAEAYVNLFFDRKVEVQLIPIKGERTWSLSLSSSARHRFRRASELLGFASPLVSQPPARWIRVEMPSSDIRTIYRALPSDGRLAIRLNQVD